MRKGDGVIDKNSMAFWLPPLQDANLRVPATTMLHTDVQLIDLMDGVTPDGYETFIKDLRKAADDMGYPCFLRTGHTSAKHGWDLACYLADPAKLERHVTEIVHFSCVADLFGLPMDTWAVRRMIPTTTLFRCRGFGNFPVTREFRFFIDGEELVHVQPYWPPDAVADGEPDNTHWREILFRASQLPDRLKWQLTDMARHAVQALNGGFWSVDLLEDEDGQWWLTDMALGEQSYRYEPKELFTT